MHLKNVSARFELPVTETLPPGLTGEREGLKLLARFGIPAVEGVAHKAAVGLVRLGLETPSDVAAALQSLRERMAELSNDGDPIILKSSVNAESSLIHGRTGSAQFPQPVRRQKSRSRDA